MEYLFIGLILGIIVDKYIFSIFDIFLEIFQYKMSEIATTSKIKSEIMAREYELKYPEKEESSTNLIGYQYEQPEEIYEDDELDDCKNKIGFKIK